MEYYLECYLLCMSMKEPQPNHYLSEWSRHYRGDKHSKFWSNRSLVDCLFDLLLYVPGKQLSCWDSQLLNHSVPGQASQRQFTSI